MLKAQNVVCVINTCCEGGLALDLLPLRTGSNGMSGSRALFTTNKRQG